MTKDEKVNGLLTGFSLGSVDTLGIGHNKGEKLGFPDEKYLDQKLEPWMD